MVGVYIHTHRSLILACRVTEHSLAEKQKKEPPRERSRFSRGVNKISPLVKVSIEVKVGAFVKL